MYFKNLKYLMIYFYAFILLWGINKIMLYILKRKEKNSYNIEKNNWLISKNWINSLNEEDFKDECYNYLSKRDYSKILINTNDYVDFMCYVENSIFYGKAIYLYENEILKDEILKFVGYLLRNGESKGIIFFKQELTKDILDYLEKLFKEGIHIEVVTGNQLRKSIIRYKEEKILMEDN